jgi:hypothetical protein
MWPCERNSDEVWLQQNGFGLTFLPQLVKGHIKALKPAVVD